MTQEQKQRHRRGSSGITVYSDSHLGSVLYGKRPRMQEDDSLASLGQAKDKSKHALAIAGRVLLFPFLAIYTIGSAIYKRLKLSSKDKKPIATNLVPYYKPQINTSGVAATFTAADATGDIALDDFPKQSALQRLTGKRRAKSLEDEIFNGKSRKGRRTKWVAAVTALLLVAGIGGYTAWWYNEGRFSTITVSDNGKVMQVRTADETVEQVLAAGGITLGENDTLSMHPSTEIREGLNVGIVRAKSVTISTKDGEQTVEMASGTVADALNKANIHFDEDDEITPALDTEVSEGLLISKVDVMVTYETKTEVIPFQEVRQESNSIYKGESEIKTEGENGEKSIKERVVIKDGNEAAREIIATNVEREPVNKLILDGTKVKVVEPIKLPEVASTGSSSGKSGSSSGGKTGSSSSGGGSSSSGSSGSSGGGSSASSGGGAVRPDGGREFVVDFITAYTHTGNKTASGKWPAVGMIAVNPKFIPLGTKVYIPGYGTAIAEDTGGAFRGNNNGIDLFMDTEAECRRWGRKFNITVIIY